MDHIGIDVHKRESQIYLLGEEGEVVEQRIRTEPERFAAVLGPGPRARVLMEASTDSEWVARCLEVLGHEVIVADPNFAPMYATRSRKVKTDRRDARTLAEACLLGAYRPAHRLSDPQRHVRGRLLVRDAVVRTRPRYISLIRALLRQHGYRVPSGSAETFGDRVQRLPLPGRLLSVIAPLLAVMRPSTGSSRTPTPPSNTSPSKTPACPACVPSPASVRSLPPPSSLPSMTPGASTTPTNSKPISASCPASTARARLSGGAPSPRPVTRAPAGFSSRRPSPSSAAPRRRPRNCAPGPCASRRAVGNRSPSSPSPAASPASSMPCCGMAPCSSPSAFGSAVSLLQPS